MIKGAELNGLLDSIDLLTMLEHLMTGFAETDEGSKNIPWAGMQLTLEQIREKIVRAHNLLQQLTHQAVTHQGVEASPYNNRAVNNGANSVANTNSNNYSSGSFLSGRIQMAPSGGNLANGQTGQSGVQKPGRTREISAETKSAYIAEG